MNNIKKRYTINDARVEESERLFIYTRASKAMHTNTTLVLPHTSRDSGDTHSIELPMTTNPLDLSEFAPKDEWLRNTYFLAALNKRLIELVSEEEALNILETPEGIAESERLYAEKMRLMSASLSQPINDDFRVADFPKEAIQGDGAPGQINKEMAGVSPAVASILANPEMEDSIRASMLRNHKENIGLTEADRKYIRSKVNDPAIREIVA